MTDYLVFDTDADATAALAQLDARDAMGFANPATVSSTWDVIRHRATDGKPVFRKPDDQWMHFILDKLDGSKPYTVEPLAEDWFPPPPDPIKAAKPAR